MSQKIRQIILWDCTKHYLNVCETKISIKNNHPLACFSETYRKIYCKILYIVNSIDTLNELADFILIDTGAGISDQVLEFVMASPEVLLVSTPEPSSLTDAYSLLKALYRNPDFVEEETTIHIVTNRVNSRDEGQAIYEKVNSVVSKFLHGCLFLNKIGIAVQCF